MLAAVQVSSERRHVASVVQSRCPLTTTLDTVVVGGQRLTPAMQEFEARRKLGFGQFMTQKEIDKRNVERVSRIFSRYSMASRCLPTVGQ